MSGDLDSAEEKALKINLDAVRYGTFAEIGAGQEVARWFFQAGKAASTVAKTISAYDKSISDALYGTTSRFVSRERLESMLDCEYRQLLQQLDTSRGDRTAFFAFADTVATHGSSRTSAGGHGWLGVRFQDRPKAEASEVIIHIEMLEAFTSRQQDAVGRLGVNLIYGTYAFVQDPTAFMKSLMDGLDRRRIEIDLIKFSGPSFPGVDNRLRSLELLEMGYTDAAMFLANGDVVQPSEVLYNRPVLIERGSFRPITNVTLSMLDDALAQLRRECDPASGEPSVLMEMTLNNLMSGPVIDHRDFLIFTVGCAQTQDVSQTPSLPQSKARQVPEHQQCWKWLYPRGQLGSGPCPGHKQRVQHRQGRPLLCRRASSSQARRARLRS